ncbi:hypothetical protein SDC9_120209 [bioreactor metagenome]|uniref:NAD-specific glutamate dehydrogenase n=1 Tax=bioreactor metagenome TaxID=1076179 RepID=A0A645C956_9ZZZZ
MLDYHSGELAIIIRQFVFLVVSCIVYDAKIESALHRFIRGLDILSEFVRQDIGHDSLKLLSILEIGDYIHDGVFGTLDLGGEFTHESLHIDVVGVEVVLDLQRFLTNPDVTIECGVDVFDDPVEDVVLGQFQIIGFGRVGIHHFRIVQPRIPDDVVVGTVFECPVHVVVVLGEDIHRISVGLLLVLI